MVGDDGHEGEGGGVDGVEDGSGGGGAANARDDGSANGDEDKGGEENTSGGDEGGGGSTQDVANKGGGGENWAGCELADGDGIEELGFSEPAVLFDKAAAEKGKEDIATAVEDGADFDEEKEEGPEAEGDGGS